MGVLVGETRSENSVVYRISGKPLLDGNENRIIIF